MIGARSLVAAATLALAATGGAHAAVLSNVSNLALSANLPVTLSIPNSTATFSFFQASSGFGPGAAVSTSGTGEVTTAFGGVTDFSSGAAIDGTGLFGFASASTPALIPFSAADDFIGLSFMQAGAVHYGYAEVFGPTLVGYGVETSADTTILTGATGEPAPAPTVGSAAVPEPATAALTLSMLAMLTWRRRRN